MLNNIYKSRIFDNILFFNKNVYLYLIFVSCTKIDVRFSPNGNCKNLILNTIKNSKKHIFVLAYFFTSKHIAQELIKAKKRNVKVIIILDKSQITIKKSMYKYLLDNDIEVFIDNISNNGISHNKIMIIDNDKVITGSYNYTYKAERKNSENLILIKNVKINNIYMKYWLCRYNNSSRLCD